MKKRKSLYFFICLIGMLAVIWIPQKTYAAAPKIITLLDAKTTSKSCSYDLDNDGKKESLKLKSKQLPGVMNQELTIWVQGKQVFKKKYTGASVVEVKLLINSSGKATFFTNAYEFCVFDARLYEYRKGKPLINIGNVETNYRDNIRGVKVTKITGNKLYIRFTKCPQGIGMINWTAEYNLKDGKWKKKSNNCPAYYDNRTEYSKNKWIAKQSFPVYSSVNLKTKKFNMKANETFKINKVYTGNARYLYVQVTKKNGQSGWIKEITKAPSKYSYVKNPIYG